MVGMEAHRGLLRAWNNGNDGLRRRGVSYESGLLYVLWNNEWDGRVRLEYWHRVGPLDCPCEDHGDTTAVTQ